MPALGFFGSSVDTPAVRDLGTTAFWNDIPNPRAAYYNGKTYIGFIRDTGHVYVCSWNHATHTLSTPVDLVTTTSGDGVIHNSPSVLVRASDKRIIVAVSQDSNPTGFSEIFTSTNPEDATAFGAANVIDNTRYDPTYPSLFEIGSAMYYMVRWYDTGTLTFYTGYYKSTDGGSTWAAFQKLIAPVATDSQYHRMGTNGSRIDIYTTDTNRRDSPSSVYHMYLDSSDNLRKSDGTLIGAASGGPYLANTGTLVKSSAEGSARPEGWAYDGSGNPACLVMVNSGGTTNLVRQAAYSGTWTVNNVVDVGGIIDSNVYISSGAMSKTDPYKLYIPVKVGSHFEMKQYTSTDSGASWSATSLTTGSTNENAMPDTPYQAGPGLLVVWGQGTYTNDSSFSFELTGYGS